MQRSEQINEIAGALAKARAMFGVIVRDKIVEVTTRSGGRYQFVYAPLENVIDAVMKPLTDNGIVFVQGVVDGAIETTLLHSSGQWISHLTPMIIGDASAQGYGSSMTYARRYGLTSLLGIASEEDDDANRNDGNQVKKRKSRDDGKVTPTAGAFDSLPVDLQEWMRARASEIETEANDGNMGKAWEIYDNAKKACATFEDGGITFDEPTQHAALRSILPSKVKTALQKFANENKG